MDYLIMKAAGKYVRNYCFLAVITFFCMCALVFANFDANNAVKNAQKSKVPVKNTLKSKATKVNQKTNNGKSAASTSHVTKQKIEVEKKTKTQPKQLKRKKTFKKKQPVRFVPIEKIIDQEKNVIGNAASLGAFFNSLQKIEKKGEGKVNILHIGDSHIQSGVLAKVVRQKLQKVFGNAGRGLICPYALARTNGPRDYTIASDATWTQESVIHKEKSLNIGICGLTILSDAHGADLTITLNSRDAVNNKFNKISVFHENRLLNTDLVFLDTNGGKMAGVVNRRLEQGCCNYVSSAELAEYRDGLKIQALPKEGDADFTQINGIILESGNPGILYHNVGINGATYQDYNEEAFIRQVAYLEPELIIISLGTNESFARNFHPDEFIGHVDILISGLKKHLSRAAFILTVPPYSLKGRSKNWNVPVIRRELLSYCQKNNLAYWDLFSVMGGLGSMRTWQANKLASPDSVHFLTSGYELQGKLLFDALIKSYDQYATH